MKKTSKKAYVGIVCICALVAVLVFGGKAILIRCAEKIPRSTDCKLPKNLTEDITTKKTIYISTFPKKTKNF